MKKNTPINKRGFTLMEVIVSIAIITIALISVVSLISFSISGIAANKSKITAFGLAQEGLEIIRGVRDNNWLNHRSTVANWRTGLSPGTYRVQYNNQGLLLSSNVPLKIDSSGFYQYSSGNDTVFYRTVTISNVDDNQFKVVVTVSWNEKGRSLTMTAENRLYNWLKEDEE
jgi:prepilin-type N-terminal cleavage/methylation domain-containing protein